MPAWRMASQVAMLGRCTTWRQSRSIHSSSGSSSSSRALLLPLPVAHSSHRHVSSRTFCQMVQAGETQPSDDSLHRQTEEIIDCVRSRCCQMRGHPVGG